MSEFDAIAPNYEKLVEDGMVLSGNDHEYFTQYKLLNLLPILQRRRSAKILDYGCGIGLLSQAIVDSLPDITLHGFDISEKSIRKVPARLLTGNNIFTNDLNKLDTDYDCVIFSTVLHHVPPDERKTVIKNAYDRLSDGGVIAIIEHNMLNPLTRKSVDACPFDEDAVMLKPAEVSNLLSDGGFSAISNRYITFFPKQLSVLRKLDGCLGWLPLGAQYLVTAEKKTVISEEVAGAVLST